VDEIADRARRNPNCVKFPLADAVCAPPRLAYAVGWDTLQQRGAVAHFARHAMAPIERPISGFE